MRASIKSPTDRARLTRVVKIIKQGLFKTISMRDLTTIFYSILGKYEKNYFIEASYKKYSTLKAVARVKNKKIIINISDGFEVVSEEIIQGLAEHLFGKLFKKKPRREIVAPYLNFISSKQATTLNHSLKKRSGKKKANKLIGTHYDLSRIVERVLTDYPLVFKRVKIPDFTWSTQKNKRVLGWHDGAWNRVTINKGLDSKCVPPHVLEYVVFHEMLHAKHEVKHNKTRRTIHTRKFKEDEKKFFLMNEAEKWLQTKW